MAATSELEERDHGFGGTTLGILFAQMTSVHAAAHLGQCADERSAATHKTERWRRKKVTLSDRRSIERQFIAAVKINLLGLELQVHVEERLLNPEVRDSKVGIGTAY